MEEFDEADVLWPDQHRGDHGHGRHYQQQQGRQSVQSAPRRVSSAPVGIPVVRSAATAWTRSYGDDGADGAAASASASFVPPHEIMAARRRCSESEERAAFSVCVGHGRTLKGRDLRSVRTAVLRMTGFLES